jgi:hypothetical protein
VIIGFSTENQRKIAERLAFVSEERARRAAGSAVHKTGVLVNLKTAKALGLAFPLPLIGPPRRVIE